MGLSIACPVCQKSFFIAEPVGVESLPNGKINVWGRPPKSEIVHTVCAECYAYLRYDEAAPTEWRQLSDEEILALPDDDRIMLGRMRRYLEKKQAEREARATDDEHAMLIRLVRVAPGLLAENMLKRAIKNGELKELASGACRSLLRTILHNKDPLLDNVRDLTAVTAVLAVLECDGDAERVPEWIAEYNQKLIKEHEMGDGDLTRLMMELGRLLSDH